MSRRKIYVCDCCGKEIPVVKREDIFGIERDKISQDLEVNDNMLKCLIDASVPEDSKCSKCCFYCDEKDNCECRCVGLEEWKTEEEIENNCTECE